MYNYGARYYDPSLSVWMGVDPLADKFPGWSPYNYTMNNPINMIDPDGRAAVGTDGTDDWILRAGVIEYDATIHSEKDAFMTYGNSATYLGSGGVIRAKAGNLYLQEDGSSSYMLSPTYGVSVDAGNESNWFSNFFNQSSDNRGGFAIFAEGSRNGWSFDGPSAGANGEIEAIDISGMLTPGGGNAGKFINMSGSAVLKFAYGLTKWTESYLGGLEQSVENSGGYIHDGHAHYPRSSNTRTAVDSMCNSCKGIPHFGFPYRRVDARGNVIDTLQGN